MSEQDDFQLGPATPRSRRSRQQPVEYAQADPHAEEPALALRTPADPATGHVPKRILVLGATSGISEACIRMWAERGDALFLVARNADRLAAVTADAKTRGASFVDSAVADLDRTENHADLLAHAINSLAGLDIAFLPLGVLGDQIKAEKSFAHTEEIMQTNLLSPASLLTWLGNYCAQRHSGVLGVVSSVAGDRGRKSNYVYGASKAGLTAFTDGLRNRIDREGVRVVTIKPGPVKTAMTHGMKGYEKMADVEKVAATIIKALDAPHGSGPDVLYVPSIWRIIMTVIRAVPESIFKKLNL